MKSLSVSNNQTRARNKVFAARFHPTLGHVLAALVLLSLIGWGVLLLAVRLLAAAL